MWKIWKIGPPLIRRNSSLQRSMTVLGVGVLLFCASCAVSNLSQSDNLLTNSNQKAPFAVGQPAPNGIGPLEAVSCATSKDCWVVGEPEPTARFAKSSGTEVRTTVLVTHNGGAKWSKEFIQAVSSTVLSGISCPTSTFCMAVGTTNAIPSLGEVVTTRDGGQIWHQVSSPTGSVSVMSARCWSRTYCLALASDGTSYWSVTTTDGGNIWQRTGTLPTGMAGVRDLSCRTTMDCIVAGYIASTPGHGTGAVALTTTGGTNWSLATLPVGSGLLGDAVCASESMCVAVGTTTNAFSDLIPSAGMILSSSDGGSSWVNTQTPSGLNDGFGVACPDSTTCVAVGIRWISSLSSTQPATPSAGLVLTTSSGQTWIDLPNKYAPIALGALACPTVNTCLAVGGNSLVQIELSSHSAN